MILARLVRLAKPAGNFILQRARRDQCLFTLDDRRIGFQPGFGRGYRVSERAFTIDQPLIPQQELG